jgi:[acyl-carrier-protein] S-malonyltransferase
MKNYAIVFPGQGSQSVGMLNHLAKEYPVVEQTFQTGSEIFGEDLWALAQNGPEATLNQTFYTQAVMLLAGVAIWRVVTQKINLAPTFLAGHSLGEYTALVCADVLSFPDAIRLVMARAQAMQAAVPTNQGAMGAIVGLSDDIVAHLCQNISEGMVTPANFNSPGQVVVAGEVAAVHAVLAQAKIEGAKIAKLIPVSVPSHCPLMQPALAQLQPLLDTIHCHTPKWPILHNVDVASHSSAAAIRTALLTQLISPVRWVATIETMVAAGVRTVYEFGPGRVLTGLNKRIHAEIEVKAINEPQEIISLQEEFTC